MIDIGAVVDAVVCRVEPYGLLLTHGEDTILVTVDKVTWIPQPSTLASYHPGQSVTVLVERLDYQTKVYAGSMKILHPEENPYRKLSRQRPDRIFTGKVKMIHQNGIVIDLGDGCSGELPLSKETASLAEGSQVQVQVTSLELNEKRMTLKLVPRQTA